MMCIYHSLGDILEQKQYSHPKQKVLSSPAQECYRQMILFCILRNNESSPYGLGGGTYRGWAAIGPWSVAGPLQGWGLQVPVHGGSSGAWQPSWSYGGPAMW